MTIKTASTIHTLQGVTTDPGLIFHWKFPRFFSEELRWLATYVALSRPPSLAQLISVGLPDELRKIIEAGPPEGILSRFNDMFEEKEKATHIRAAEVMRELGWTQQIRVNCYRAFHSADQVQDHNALLKSMHILGECIHPEERNAPLHVDT